MGSWRPYLEAAAGVVLVTLARMPMQPWLQGRVPYSLYFPVVAWAVWRGGWVPGIASAVASAVVGTYFFVAPFGAFELRTPADRLAFAYFLVAALTIVLFGEGRRRSESALELAQEQLRLANADLERRVAERTAELEGFTYAVAHDLRTPLRGLVANSRLVREEQGDALVPDAARHLVRMESSALRLSQLVDDLLQYARTGTAPIRQTAVNIGDLFGEEFHRAVTEHGAVGAELHADKGLVVKGDIELLRLVLWNLADNAVKYRSPDRPLRVRLCRESPEVLRVEDNGIGFDMMYADKLFRPFQRLHRDDEYPGTGIGLANVRRIVERHGGKIEAEGKPGVGSIFRLWLS